MDVSVDIPTDSVRGFPFLSNCTVCKLECLVAQSCLTSLQPYGLYPARVLCPWDSPGKNSGLSCHSPPGEFSRPRNQTQISCIAGGFFTGWATIAILTDVRWYFTAAFIFISMMISAVEHLFICLLVICCSSSLENMYLGSLFFFKSGYCFFSVSWVPYYFGYYPLQIHDFQIFSPIQQVAIASCQWSPLRVQGLQFNIVSLICFALLPVLLVSYMKK